MRRGLLLIDRGSREKEAKEELEKICAKVKEKGNYVFSNFCFLEVIPPFICEGIKEALEHNLNTLTIVPYFLYPGKKVKAAVSDAMKLQKETNVKFLITRAMSMHNTLLELVNHRIKQTLEEKKVDISKKDIDVLVIGHGSKDPNAKISIKYITDGLMQDYRNVSYCFLEIEEPNISQAIQRCKENDPKVLVIVFYFLHEGAHVKRDIYEDLNPALEESGLKDRSLITKHIGVDEKMIDLIIERAREVEKDAD